MSSLTVIELMIPYKQALEFRLVLPIPCIEVATCEVLPEMWHAAL
jgi:hypothetical protein